MDVFCEYMVKHKKTFKDTAVVAVSILVALFLSMLIFLLLFGKITGLALLLIIAVWYGAAFVIGRTNIEYEYILTNNILDIDKIIAKKSRKRVMSIDLYRIDACAPSKAHVISGSANSGFKALDLTGEITGERVYHIDFVRNGTKTRVFFQPNAKMLNELKSINPRLITVSEEDLK